ncbi:MAG: hypothetical protein U1D69_10385, partial [Polynucleobacter sp.]|nr:hypothetical protein [Polynucleobacter sp.]
AVVNDPYAFTVSLTGCRVVVADTPTGPMMMHIAGDTDSRLGTQAYFTDLNNRLTSGLNQLNLTRNDLRNGRRYSASDYPGAYDTAVVVGQRGANGSLTAYVQVQHGPDAITTNDSTTWVAGADGAPRVPAGQPAAPPPALANNNNHGLMEIQLDV